MRGKGKKSNYYINISKINNLGLEFHHGFTVTYKVEKRGKGTDDETKNTDYV